jgi:hypothetical protein
MDIESETENRKVVRKLNVIFPDMKISFDVEHEKISFFPCQHNILRVEGLNINPSYPFIRKLGL